MMTLGKLISQLQAIRAEEGVSDASPVVLEGHDEDSNFVQAGIDGVETEARCEDDGEPQGVYLSLSEISIG